MQPIHELRKIPRFADSARLDKKAGEGTKRYQAARAEALQDPRAAAAHTALTHDIDGGGQPPNRVRPREPGGGVGGG